MTKYCCCECGARVEDRDEMWCNECEEGVAIQECEDNPQVEPPTPFDHDPHE